MPRLLIILLIAIAPMAFGQATIANWERSDVRTPLLYRTGDEQEQPILTLGQRGSLTLEFDLMQSEAEALIWRIIHLDRHWMPDGLPPSYFMTGFAEGTMDDYDYSFATQVDYVHYRLLLPGEMSTFSHSGNYAVQVLREEDSALVLCRRFYVSEQAIGVRIECTTPYDGMDRERRQEVDVRLSSEKIPLNPLYITVVAQQNRRQDNQRELVFSGYDRQALRYDNRPQNCFFGGNTFRYFDCSHLGAAIYNIASISDYGGQTLVQLHPCEVRSRKPYTGEKALAGGMKVNVRDRQRVELEADYAWVQFTLPMAQPMLEGEVHIVGELTGWRLDSVSRMDYQPELHAYTKTLLLKQGYYAYQLLVKPFGVRASDSKTAPLEGDHRETPNQYSVFVYQHTPSDRADRLIAIGRSQAGN